MAAANICMPFRPAFENSVAIPGAQAVVTLSGTTTLVSVYSNQAMTVAATNPIVANSVGRFPQRWVSDSVALRMRVFDADADIDTDDPIEDFDPYTPVETGAAAPTPDWTFSVVTGSPGTDASIDVTGTYPDQNIELTIPRGTAGASGALSDGDMGDIVVSDTGATLTVDAGAITLAKMANLDEDRIIGRQSSGSGVPEALLIGAANATDILDRAAGDGRYLQETEDVVISLPIMAAAMTSRTTSGAATGTTQTSSNKVMLPSFDFDASTDEFAQFLIAMPKSWNEGTVTAQFGWMNASGTGDVVWGIQGVSVSNDDALDAAFGTAVTVTDSVTTAGDLMVTSATSAMTIAGTPAAEDLVCFQVYRDADNGSDTLAVDAKLLFVRLNFTTNARTDA